MSITDPDSVRRADQLAVHTVAGEGTDSVRVLPDGRDSRVGLLQQPTAAADSAAGPVTLLPYPRLLPHLLLHSLPHVHIPYGCYLVVSQLGSLFLSKRNLSNVLCLVRSGCLVRFING